MEVRCFNPARIDNPFGWLTRDHRKMLAVDGRIGFVTGLCLSARWEGDASKGLEPWRDTGVALEGPRSPTSRSAFAEVWATTGEPIPPVRAHAAGIDAAARRHGAARHRNRAGHHRRLPPRPHDVVPGAEDTLAHRCLLRRHPDIRAGALPAPRATAWTCACSCPGSSDVPLVSPLSRSGYRPLLEAGRARVRVERHHAARQDGGGRRAYGRGSARPTSTCRAGWGTTNSTSRSRTPASPSELEAIYLEDLANATEIVLSKRSRVQPIIHPAGHRRWRRLRERDLEPCRHERRALGQLGGRRHCQPARTGAGGKPPDGLDAASCSASSRSLAIIWPRVVTIPVGVARALACPQVHRPRLAPPPREQDSRRRRLRHLRVQPSPRRNVSPDWLPDDPLP